MGGVGDFFGYHHGEFTSTSWEILPPLLVKKSSTTNPNCNPKYEAYLRFITNYNGIYYYNGIELYIHSLHSLYTNLYTLDIHDSHIIILLLLTLIIIVIIEISDNIYIYIIFTHYISHFTHIYIYKYDIISIPVVPHKAVAEVSKIGNP